MIAVEDVFFIYGIPIISSNRSSFKSSWDPIMCCQFISYKMWMIKIGEVKEETEKRQADTKDFTSSSKFSGSCVLTLQTYFPPLITAFHLTS